jgi:DNA polymerase-4
MYALLRGEEVERAASQRWTVGHSHVLEPKRRTIPQAEAVLHRLLQKAAVRLRGLGYVAGGLAVSVKFLGHGRWSDEMDFLETQETLDLIRVFGLLWQRLPASSPPPLAVGVTLFHLAAAHEVTPSLPRMRVSRRALDQAVDRLNQCYGRNTVYFGGAQAALDSAPTRIAFTHVPEMEKEREELNF